MRSFWSSSSQRLSRANYTLMTCSSIVNRRDATRKKHTFLHAIIHGIEAQIRGSGGKQDIFLPENKPTCKL